MDWSFSNEAAAPVRCCEDGAELKGEALDLTSIVVPTLTYGHEI